jgi:nitroreductase
MNVFEAIKTVLAVREYREEPVPKEIIRNVLEAGRSTGSSMNAQPWHFVVIRERSSLQKLGELVRSGSYTAHAAFAVAVAVEKSSIFGVSDGSRAIQSMMLAAWEEGIGSNWAGFAGGNLDGARDFLGIPNTFDVIAIVPFGVPLHQLGKGKKKRRAVKEVVSGERFGQPFP